MLPLRLISAFLLTSLIFSHALAAPTNLSATHEVTVVSDIHFSPFTACKNAKNCVLITKLNQANADQWPQILAQYGGNNLPANGEATNYALFHSLLLQLQQKKPEIVLILGDFLAHRYRSDYLRYAHDHNREHYNSFVIKTIQYMTNAIQQVLSPDSAIYPVIGNNDSFGGKDCAYPDYCTIANGAFYKTLANQWVGLFKDAGNKAQFIASFPHAGYYEIILPNSHDHILVLNSVLFSPKAQGPNLDKEAQAELNWLQQKLQHIADEQGKAWIIFHIPPAIDAYATAKNFFSVVTSYWDPTYSKQFLNLVHQYNAVITGVLSGHTHMDGFLILDIKIPTNIIIDTFVPSISPIFGNNPAFKTYTYDMDHFTLHNFASYYLNLHNPDASTQGWQKEYKFSAVYQPTDGLFSGYKKITADETNPYSVDYINFYSAQTTSQPINQGKWSYYWCATNTVNVGNYQDCLKKTN